MLTNQEKAKAKRFHFRYGLSGSATALVLHKRKSDVLKYLNYVEKKQREKKFKEELGKKFTQREKLAMREMYLNKFSGSLIAKIISRRKQDVLDYIRLHKDDWKKQEEEKKVQRISIYGYMRVAGSKKYTRISIDLIFTEKIDEKKIMNFLEDAKKVRFWDLDEDGHGKNITVAGTMIKREKDMQFNDNNWQQFIGDKIRELIEEMSKNEKK